jgi:hypothetical protein
VTKLQPKIQPGFHAHSPTTRLPTRDRHLGRDLVWGQAHSFEAFAASKALSLMENPGCKHYPKVALLHQDMAMADPGHKGTVSKQALFLPKTHKFVAFG